MIYVVNIHVSSIIPRWDVYHLMNLICNVFLEICLFAYLSRVRHFLNNRGFEHGPLGFQPPLNTRKRDLHDYWWSVDTCSAPLFTRVSKTYSTAIDLMTRPHSWSSICSNIVSVMVNLWLASPITKHQSGSNHFHVTPMSPTWAMKSPSRTIESPDGTLPPS